MAGFPYRASGRKQWQVRRDIGYETLYGLRGQLAKDGCADSQLVIAKDLLQDQTGDKDENARQGVYWLIRASEQGNEEATETLQQCLEKGRGITELNFPDVKACLNMSQEEKLARKAARKLFERLSAGEDYITSAQLIQEIRKVRRALDSSSRHPRGPLYFLTFGCSQNSKDQSIERISSSASKSNGVGGDHVSHPSDEEEKEEVPSEDWCSRVEPPGEKLSEEHLVSAAVTYSHGELPLVERMFDLQRPVLPDTFNPLSIISHAYTSVIDALGGHNQIFSLSLLPTAVQILLAVILYSLFESVDWYTIAPIAVYHGSFMAMIVFTCQMLHHSREFQHFRVWSGLFLRYSEGSLNPEEAEYQYCKNNLKPYAHFFVALIINLMVYPLLVPHWTPHSELTVVASSLMFLTLYTFLNTVPRPLQARRSSNFQFPRKQLDVLVLLSFAFNVLAKYPYDMDSVVTQSWRFLDVKIPTFASYVIGHGIEFCLNFRAIFYLLMPAVFLKIAARDQWRGTYRTLIPHCVTLAWWQIAVLTAKGSTWYGLIRAAFALVGLVLFLPLAGLASILLPLGAAIQMLYISAGREVLQAGGTILAASPLLIFLWLRGKRSPQSSLSARLSRAALTLQVILAVSAVFFLLTPLFGNIGAKNLSPHPAPEPSNHILVSIAGQDVNVGGPTWEQYEAMCHKPAWERSSIAYVQQLCSPLEGLRVKWDGYVSNIKITRVQNTWADILKRLPDTIGSAIACAVTSLSEDRSQDDTHCQDFSHTLAEHQNCLRIKQLSAHSQICSLTHWNRYNFEVEVKMKNVLWGKSAVDVYLDADDQFRNMTYHLRPGDHVWFSGIITGHSPHNTGPEPHLLLESMGCLQCEKGPLLLWEKAPQGFTLTLLVSYLLMCVRFILNCLLNPIVIFK